MNQGSVAFSNAGLTGANKADIESEDIEHDDDYTGSAIRAKVDGVFHRPENAGAKKQPAAAQKKDEMMLEIYLRTMSNHRQGSHLIHTDFLFRQRGSPQIASTLFST